MNSFASLLRAQASVVQTVLIYRIVKQNAQKTKQNKKTAVHTKASVQLAYMVRSQMLFGCSPSLAVSVQRDSSFLNSAILNDAKSIQPLFDARP